MDGPAVNEAAEVFDDIAAEMGPALSGVGAAMVETIQEFISIDVQRAKGRVIRSAPGEHPRRDTGRLFGSIAQDVEREGDLFTITVDTDTPYAPYLEFGTSKMAIRPIFDGMLERFEPILMNTAIAVIEGR
jgi:hypothetical protein